MATKKQKRLEMQAKRNQFEEDRRQSGLLAQKRDREYRARRAAKRKEEAEAENRRLEAILAAAKMKRRELEDE